VARAKHANCQTICRHGWWQSQTWFDDVGVGIASNARTIQRSGIRAIHGKARRWKVFPARAWDQDNAGGLGYDEQWVSLRRADLTMKQPEPTKKRYFEETQDYRRGFVEGQAGERDAYFLLTGCTDIDEYERGFADGAATREKA
jgi:hypothetical protein